MHEKIKDVAISLSAEEWLDVPEAIEIYREVKLTPSDLKKVKHFTREKVLELEDIDIRAGEPPRR